MDLVNYGRLCIRFICLPSPPSHSFLKSLPKLKASAVILSSLVIVQSTSMTSHRKYHILKNTFEDFFLGLSQTQFENLLLAGSFCVGYYFKEAKVVHNPFARGTQLFFLKVHIQLATQSQGRMFPIKFFGVLGMVPLCRSHQPGFYKLGGRTGCVSVCLQQ